MDYINLEVVGVFKDTNKTIAIATIWVIKPEIRTLNKAKAIRDIINRTSYLNDITTFIAFIEQFRNSPIYFNLLT
jgi:hypothetical protein